MADTKDVTVGVNLTSQPAPGAQSSEMKVLVAASALTAVAGIFHKQLDMTTATQWVDGMAALYMLGRSGVKMAHALASAVMAWVTTQKATRPALPPFPFPPFPQAPTRPAAPPPIPPVTAAPPPPTVA